MRSTLVPILWLAALGAAALGAPESARAASPAAAAARSLMDRYSQSVVTVRVVAKVRMVMEGREMDEDEQTQETKATVISPSGLCVTALSSVDPVHIVEMIMAGQQGFRWEADITDVKIRPAEGREISARIVLRDRDLDLAFIQPTEPLPQPIAPVDFAPAVEPGLLDQVLILTRLGEVVNREPALLADHIAALVEKPRRLYVTGMSVHMTGLGCPVFTLEGAPVGLLVMRALPSTGADERDMLPVILPAAALLRAAGQVPGD